MSNNEVKSKLKVDTTSDGVEYEMKKTVETKEDGRQLIYYKFVRKAPSEENQQAKIEKHGEKK